MSNPRTQQQTILTADGELQEVEAPVQDVQTIYCIHCGTANRSIASFCRKCGQALDEELDTHTGSGRKSKRHAEPDRAFNADISVPMMIFSVFKVAIVGAVIIVIATASNVSGWIYILAAIF